MVSSEYPLVKIIHLEWTMQISRSLVYGCFSFGSALSALFSASATAAQCRNVAGHDPVEFRFLLQGRSVEVKNAREQSLYQSVFTGVNTGELVTDPGSPYNGYAIFQLSSLFGGSAPQIKMAFDHVDAFGDGRNGRAVLFIDIGNQRQILHEFACGEES